jgi:putative DNA primase/helicase
MVSAVQGPSGRITGVHRTYLKPDGSGKADVKKPKLMAGICWEGAIRLCPAGSRLAIAEGIETALSVFAATQTPTWPTGSMGNLAAIIVPPIVRDLVICVDGDSSPAETERVIEKAGAFHSARGLRVAVVRPPVGMDFNDVLRRGA